VPRAELLAWEKELLGVYVSEHPFSQAAVGLAPYVTLCVEVTPELLTDAPAQGRDVAIAGMVGGSRRLTTRDGRPFIAAFLEDLSGAIEVTVWPDVYERTTDLWSQGRIVVAQVRVRERGDRLSVGVQQVVPYDEGFRPPDWLGEASPLAAPAPEPAPVDDGPGRSLPPPDGNGRIDPEGLAFEGLAFEGLPSEAPPPTEAAYETAQQLRLVIAESEDEEEDQQRLRSLFDLVRQHPGEEEVLLTIQTRDGDAIDLALPPANLGDELRARLLEATRGPVLSA
jgi:DNA polymerase-3 subunit alpha